MSAPFHFEGVDPSLLKAPPAEPWAWWQAAFSGRPQPFSAMAPQTGFWRYKQRAADSGHPCAIWHEPGEGWICLIDGKPFRDIAHAWAFCHQRPITESTYQAVCEGAAWPGEAVEASAAPADAPPPAGHNAALPEELALDAVRQADEAFRAQLVAWGGAVTNEEQDAAAKSYDARIVKLRQDAEKARKAEKDEYLRGGQAIDAKWSPVKDAAKAAEDRISGAVTPYRVERKRLADVKAAEERAARDKARAEHSAAAASAVAQGAEPPPAPIPTSGRVPRAATGLRKVETAVVDDPDALAAYLVGLKDEDLMILLRTKALRLLKAGAQAPGARLHIEHKA